MQDDFYLSGREEERWIFWGARLEKTALWFLFFLCIWNTYLSQRWKIVCSTALYLSRFACIEMQEGLVTFYDKENYLAQALEWTECAAQNSASLSFQANLHFACVRPSLLLNLTSNLFLDSNSSVDFISFLAATLRVPISRRKIHTMELEPSFVIMDSNWCELESLAPPKNDLHLPVACDCWDKVPFLFFLAAWQTWRRFLTIRKQLLFLIPGIHCKWCHS